MNFKQDANVATADGQEVGRINRVVLDPKTKKVTHVVVHKGLLFIDERVVPIGLVAEADEDQVRLRPDAGDLQSLPKFEEAHYVRVPEEVGGRGSAPGSPDAGSLYWYPPVGAMIDSGLGPVYVKRVAQNIPEGTIALREGAKVVSEDGQIVGHVEEIVTDSGTKQATHILIAKGLLTKERKMIPTFWVREFEEDGIYLAAPAKVLDKIQPHQN